jgi:hypothetical protein
VSVNLGSEAIGAVKELRGNPYFEIFLDAYGVFAQNMVLASVEADLLSRTDKTAYARGFLHTWQAMTSAYRDQHLSQVKLPAPAKTRVAANV